MWLADKGRTGTKSDRRWKKCISPFLLKDRANLENFHQVSLVNLAQLAQLAKLAWST